MNAAASLPTRRLGDPVVATLVMGQSPPSSTYNTERRGLPFYQGKADFGAVHPTPRVWCDTPARTAERNDVLISVRAPVGAVNIATESCALGRGLAAARATDHTNSLFLFFAVASVRQALVAESGGSTFESVNKTAVERLVVPYPVRDEQDRIAATLSVVHQARDFEERSVGLARELKRAFMRQMFAGESRVCRIDEVMTLTAGGTPSRTEPSYWDAGTIPWVKTGEIDYREITRTEEHITSAGLANSAAKVLPAGTVLVAMYGQGVTRGKVAMLGIPAATNQACLGLQPKSDAVRPKFVYHYLAHSYERLRSLAHGGQQQNLNRELVASFDIPCPPVDKQREIVDVLDVIDRKIALHERKRATLAELFDTLLHDLMTGRLRVRDLALA